MDKATKLNTMVIIGYILTIMFIVLMILTIIFFFKWMVLANPFSATGIIAKLISAVNDKAGEKIE